MSRNADQLALLDLFRQEVDAQADVLTTSLLAVERQDAVADRLEAGMRAAHSLKGAARIVGLTPGVRLAGAIEDCFVAAQQGRLELRHAQIDRLLGAVDLLKRIAIGIDGPGDAGGPGTAGRNDAAGFEIEACMAALDGVLNGAAALPVQPAAPAVRPALEEADEQEASDRVLRVTAESLNRLLGLAGESLVESLWVKPFTDSLVRLKRAQSESVTLVRRLRDTLPAAAAEHAQADLAAAERSLLECQQLLAERLVEIDMFDRRSSSLSQRLYDEALACRMRPFSDGTQAFPRMVRDLGRSLGKHVRLEIAGGATQVDRDILRRLDAPLGHLLRNAVDHGLETPDERLAAGKPAEGLVRLEARHSAGMLVVSVEDDGRGVDVEQVRAAVIARKLVAPEAAQALGEPELLEFLFLPGFTMRDAVTEISGRGVGLDVVQDMVKQVRGMVRVASTGPAGTRFVLQLPVTLSVVRTLLTEVNGEPYAFPLASIARAVTIPRAQVEVAEGRQHFTLDGRSIGLVTAHQILELTVGEPRDELPVVVTGDAAHSYGIVVDRFIGQRELVVQPLDPLLGKVRNVAAGALMADGSPVLILDTEDLLRSIDRICADSRLTGVRDGSSTAAAKKTKRVLVVDDSMTVRELERKLLGNLGYDVEVAVDGMDGWNAVRTGAFDLVVTDIDMPRMDGIELVTLINNDPNLKTVPVMIVSYKDRDEDRRRGLEAGAAHYLTKGSFHDETLAQAVVDLIGEAAA
jgi:two-component system, chemotaxis family, sensor histidine kinase and response regulator WspE